MILPAYNKVVFFLVLLISFSFKHLNAQVQSGDTLKKPITDTLAVAEVEDDDLEDEVTYFAEDSTVGMPPEGKVFLYGKARVLYGGMDMQSEYIEIDYLKNTIAAYGKKDSTGKNVGTPVFKDGSEAPMEAEKIVYNLKTKKGKIYNAMTKQGELLVVGNEIKKDSTNIIYMKDMKCIPCQEEDARTIFRASKAKIIPDDKIVTGPMYLEIGGVPTPLGLPFGYFPNTKKQHNGILLPTFGTSKAFGYNLQNGGFYWGINDKTDMVIRGDIYSNGSYALSTINSYKILYKSSGALNLGYSHFNNGDRDIPAEFGTLKSYTIKWQHMQDNRSNPTVHFNADVNYVSNQNVSRLNSINTGNFLQNQFVSSINFSKTFKASSIALVARNEQNSQTHRMTLTLPSLVYNVNSFFPFKNAAHSRQNALDRFRISYTLDGRNTLTGADSSLFRKNWWDSLNYGVNHSLPMSTSFNLFKYITVTPAINVSSMMLTRTIRKQFVMTDIRSKDGERDSIVPQVRSYYLNGPAAGINGNFNTSAKTQVYFDYLFRKGKVKQFRHLLIPSLNYTYRPDFGESQYNFWKQVQLDTLGRKGYYSIFEKSIYGSPARGKQSSLGFDLSNNIEAKIKQKSDSGASFKKVVIIQNISFTGDYNFAADSFKMSTAGITMRTKIFKYFDIVTSSTFDPYAYSKTTGRRIDDFSYNHGQGIARMVNTNIKINTAFGSNTLEAMRKARAKPQLGSSAERGVEQTPVNSNKLPWSTSLYYTLDLTNVDARKIIPTHNISFNADIMPTKYWKFGFSSGYSFDKGKLSYTRITLARDLKCWQAAIDWTPFGIAKQYNIYLNMKTSMLSEFKIPRRKQWQDNFQ